MHTAHYPNPNPSLFMAYLGLISIFCLGMEAASPEFCCSTMRIILRRAPDSWLEMMAGLSLSLDVTFTSKTCQAKARPDRCHVGHITG